MSRFYGYINGGRATLTRSGTANTGIHIHIKSHVNVVKASLVDRDGEDLLLIDITKGMNININGVAYKIQKDGRLRRRSVK